MFLFKFIGQVPHWGYSTVTDNSYGTSTRAAGGAGEGTPWITCRTRPWAWPLTVNSQGQLFHSPDRPSPPRTWLLLLLNTYCFIPFHSSRVVKNDLGCIIPKLYNCALPISLSTVTFVLNSMKYCFIKLKLLFSEFY